MAARLQDHYDVLFIGNDGKLATYLLHSCLLAIQ